MFDPKRATEMRREHDEVVASFGERIVELCNRLAQHSETAAGLTCTYLSPAHQATASDLVKIYEAAGLRARKDAVGNVIGRYASPDPNARTLIIGSHYDTVVDAGRYDGRLGIATAVAVMEHVRRERRHFPFHVDVVAFAEEEGVRFSSPYIGSSAITGRFEPALLQREDASGITLATALKDSGEDPERIPELARHPEQVAGYIEVHIEQGPVLLERGHPVGIVTAIAGNSRFAISVEGTSGHAGTVPMAYRRDAATAAAEIVLLVEGQCTSSDLVGTVGRLCVPQGAINVIPARCELSVDVRSASDCVRYAAVREIHEGVREIARRRKVAIRTAELLDAPAVSCSSRIQDLLANAVERLGIPVCRLPSGAGHDAVMFDQLTEVGMLFVRCGNGGVSHSPRETVTADDADVGARVLLQFLKAFPA